MRRVLLVANPASRRGARLRNAAERVLREAGIEYDVVLTERPGHGREVCLARARDYDAVFALGGDGTAMEVVDALAGSGQPVGVLPGGTGNLIARALGIPLLMRRAVEAVLRGEVRRFDLGCIDGKHRFAFAAGVGVDAEMIERTPRWLKRRLGILAYTLAATRAIIHGRPMLVRATVDGQTFERKAVSVMLANFGTILKDRITLGPGIRQDDGKLDLCVFSPSGSIDTFRLIWKLFRKDFSDDPRLLYRQGTTFRIETVPPSHFEADGELIGTTPFEARVEPLAATVLVPRK
jgi:YegS/Rv2252/BmrU family lipid kinase